MTGFAKFAEGVVVIKRLVRGGKGSGEPAQNAAPVSTLQTQERNMEDMMEHAQPKLAEKPEIPIEALIDMANQTVSDMPMEAKAYELEVDLAACSAVLAKLCTSMTPWDIQRRSAKLSDAKAQFDRSRAGVKALLTRLVMDSEYAKDAGEKLRERERLLVQIRDQDEVLQKAEQLQASQAAKMKAMLTKIDQGKSAQREARGAAGGRFGITDKEDTLQMLAEAVDSMLEENYELQHGSHAATSSQTEMSRKVKEVTDKMRNELEVRDRELQQLRGAVKRANEEKEASVAAATEKATTELTKKTADLKGMQRRLEVAKSEAEQAKAASKALKTFADKASEALAKSQEDAKLLAKKLADMRLQKEDAARQLEYNQSEQTMIFEELRQLQAAAPAAAKPAAEHFSKEAGWPRIAFISRGGRVLHRGACGSVDTNKCMTFQYEEAKELEGHMQEQGFVLCHNCRADPGF